MLHPAEAGRAGPVAKAGVGHAGRGEPAPGRAGAELPGGRVPGAPPSGGDAAQPRRGDIEGGGQQVIRRTAVLTAQHQPVNVALLDLDRCRPGGCVRHRCLLLSPWWGAPACPPPGALRR